MRAATVLVPLETAVGALADAALVHVEAPLMAEEKIVGTAPVDKDVLWVTSLDGGHIQVCHIIRFVQQSEGIVQIWTVDGKMAQSSDPNLFPQVNLLEPANAEAVASDSPDGDAGGSGG